MWSKGGQTGCLFQGEESVDVMDVDHTVLGTWELHRQTEVGWMQSLRERR